MNDDSALEAMIEAIDSYELRSKENMELYHKLIGTLQSAKKAIDKSGVKAS